jgi:hypothetical protein
MKVSEGAQSDILELAQWLYNFYKNNIPLNGDPDYDPVARRNGKQNKPIEKIGKKDKIKPSLLKKFMYAGKLIDPAALLEAHERSKSNSSGIIVENSSSDTYDPLKAAAELEWDKTKILLSTLERERNYYYWKLKNVERISQYSTDLLKDVVLKTLYENGIIRIIFLCVCVSVCLI